MDYKEKLKELLELEKTLESQLERIGETKEELNLKETIYKQQLHFVRGQIELLKSFTQTTETSYSFDKSAPLVYKNPFPILDVVTESRENLVDKDQRESGNHPFDPVLDPPTAKPANIVGMQFFT